MTGNEAKTMIYTLLGENPSSPVHFSDSQIQYWMRAVLNDAAERTRYLEGRWDLNLSSGSKQALTDNVIQVQRFETDQDGRMRPVTTAELWKVNRHWRSETGTPRFYYLDGQRDTSVGSGAQILTLYPLQSYTVEYLMYFESYPADPADDMSLGLEIPLWAAHMVVYGVLARAYKTINFRTSLAASAFYSVLYENLIKRLRVRADSRLPKRWIAGQRTHRRLSGHELFPRNIPEP